MKTLLILRHAKSSWKHDHLADHDRPLKKRGEADAVKMGECIRRQNLTPDLIISSTAKRARATAILAAEACHYDNEIKQTRAFYGAEPADYIRVLRQLDGGYQCVMIVGHNPGLESLLETFTDAFESLPTAALAQVDLPIESWQDLTEDTPGELVESVGSTKYYIT